MGDKKTLKLLEAPHGVPPNLVEIYLDVGPAGSTWWVNMEEHWWRVALMPF